MATRKQHTIAEAIRRGSGFIRGKPTAAWPDADLVEACLAQDADAWTAILEKYKRLIYSVPLRYGLQPDDAADVFQDVCLDLYSDMSRLRSADALRGWLVRVALNKCFHLKRKAVRETPSSDLLDSLVNEPATDPEASVSIEEIERNHQVHNALSTLQPRCRQMIEMLFFENPPLPYEAVARKLGVAVGSIGFVRGRCLRSLEKALREQGL